MTSSMTIYSHKVKKLFKVNRYIDWTRVMVEQLSFSTNRNVFPDAIPNKILLIGSQFDSKINGGYWLV